MDDKQIFEDEFDKSRINEVLRENINKDFVKRIVGAAEGKELEHIEYRGGIGTHAISSAERDGKNYVFPQIMRGADGELMDYGQNSWRNAFDHALKTGEYIEFPNQEEAQWFGKNYKSVWPEELQYKLKRRK